MQNDGNSKRPAWIISITPRDFVERQKFEKQLTSMEIEYQLHSTAGVYCIWCGVPIDMVNEMKTYNDGRIIWLTKHCTREYVVALRVTNLDQATGLPAMLSKPVIQQSQAVAIGQKVEAQGQSFRFIEMAGQKTGEKGR